MDEAKGPELTVKSLTTRLLVTNFVSIIVGPDVSLHVHDAQIFRSSVRRFPRYASNILLQLLPP